MLLFLAKHGNCVLQPVPTYLWRVKQTIRMSHVKLRKRKFLMTWRETMTEIYGSCVDFPLCPQILKILKLSFWFYDSKNNCASWYQKLRRHSFLEVSSTQGFITFDQWSFQEIESWCLVHLYWTKQWTTLISTLLCSHEISNCCILGQQTLVEYTQCRTNEDVRMYIWRIFILVDIWMHCCTSWNWICIGNAVVYIHSQQ